MLPLNIFPVLSQLFHPIECFLPCLFNVFSTHFCFSCSPKLRLFPVTCVHTAPHQPRHGTNAVGIAPQRPQKRFFRSPVILAAVGCPAQNVLRHKRVRATAAAFSKRPESIFPFPYSQKRTFCSVLT